MRELRFSTLILLGLSAVIAAAGALTTAKGTVEEVKQYTGRSGAGGTHVVLKTDKGTLEVHLGPSGFLAEKHFEIARGDKIEVTGTMIKSGGAEALIAREVKKGQQSLTLRDANGIPVWSGGPMGMGPGMGMGRGMGMGMGRGMGNMRTGAQGLTSGKEIFAAQCAQCHDADSSERKIGPGLKDLFKLKKLVNGKTVTDVNIRALIENGAEGMPGYARNLTTQQVNELIAYLKTL